ncbi:uncharacterized protein DUF397 [Herbihabitans rhizosphaerae]|uniref:Uncharacterized protein DUF397 n=1 Tax=Herbihabitans rhizosphaerae TaxID=1872711 RepID=A0A4Q7KG97_9PSEU|nr:DUF397 domain-containing protein [Herbihabitans rhizosphaerae]RZS34273.1 uncharacterized protein DUF397 [Herbihabitans rhizosphaerae]
MTVSDLTGAKWRKSGFSGAGNDCVELAVSTGSTALRDSKSPATGQLAFENAGWHEFLGAVVGDRLRAH